MHGEGEYAFIVWSVSRSRGRVDFSEVTPPRDEFAVGPALGALPASTDAGGLRVERSTSRQPRLRLDFVKRQLVEVCLEVHGLSDDRPLYNRSNLPLDSKRGLRTPTFSDSDWTEVRRHL